MAPGAAAARLGSTMLEPTATDDPARNILLLIAEPLDIIKILMCIYTCIDL
jgi:hypothetical protein